MTAKVRIKAGPVEFEYEGETELGVADIKDLFSHIETLFKVPVLAEPSDGHSYNPMPESPKEKGAGPTTKLHVNSIAAKLNAKSGPEVAVAAAASLQIMSGKQTFSRAELLAEMKKAPQYYNANMSKNLSYIMKGLIGDKVHQNGDDAFSLASETFEDLKKKLA